MQRSSPDFSRAASWRPIKKWRLIAEPFSSAAEAMQACGLFKKADMPCEATVYAGDAF